MQKVKALQADTSDFSSFHQIVIERRTLHPDDVAIDIKYCGICHSDIAQVEGIGTAFQHPVVPGHEITGIVSATGSDVTKFKPGDRVGVGCFIDSCGKCKYCLAGQEQFCEKGFVSVFNTPDYDGNITQGGYSQSVVVKQHFVLHIPDNLSLSLAAPLLCAGITTYNPLKRYGINGNSNIAIIGLGGLGHIAVQFARRLGANVTVLGHSESKRSEAAQFGASNYEILQDENDFDRLSNKYDFILNTAAVKLDLDNYLKLLTVNGIFCFVGLTMDEQQFNIFSIFDKQGTITVSNVGGIAMTQEMLDFAAKNDVKPKIEMISIDDVPSAYQRILDSDVHYRFVIDMSTLK
ncbi:NAD(P)-dependent alcohol dehydrogenase [Furfurilactobacillus milii]|uniref:Alcohol dehydrogenase catalytic domain-containing protein n=1 Tax=Furfurilactobacillus milii TaxID=2888272 RepID=A0A6N9I5G4_9LACO|nr:NAD(P)-dependent alcohol dehydrogenase [Furfurilactobacillus milii]MYV17676.1 alcohol dehydrogenase catalytic domain-containing protein [Furfurilactobacillus milii]